MSLQRTVQEMLQEQAEGYARQLADERRQLEPPVMGDLRRSLAETRKTLDTMTRTINESDEILTSAGYRIKRSRNGPRRIPRLPPEGSVMLDGSTDSEGRFHGTRTFPDGRVEHAGGGPERAAVLAAEHDARRNARRFSEGPRPLDPDFLTPRPRPAHRREAARTPSASISRPQPPAEVAERRDTFRAELREALSDRWNALRARREEEPSTLTRADDPNVKYAGETGLKLFLDEIQARRGEYVEMFAILDDIKKKLDDQHSSVLR